MKLFVLILVGNILFFSFNSDTKDDEYLKSILTYQEEMNKEFSDSSTSPLKAEDIPSFKGLEFYPINPDFCIMGELTKVDNPKIFGMKTTTDRLPKYIKYGVVQFRIKGNDLKINVYQNIELIKKEGYHNHLFMLFTDLSSGKTSYAGGRYIDLEVPESHTIEIDFNKSYNPYCAYNNKYSCPIPPEEDFLDMEILAGVKKYH